MHAAHAPVAARRQLRHHLSRGRVPAERAVVLAAREQQRRVRRAPRHGQHALAVPHKLARRRDAVAQVPHLQRGAAVVVAGGDELRGNLRVPRQRGAAARAVWVGEANDGALPLEVPHHGGAARGGGGQDVLHLAVPRQKGHLTRAARGSAATLERRVQRRRCGARQVPDAQLAVRGAGRQQAGAERVELQAFDLWRVVSARACAAWCRVRRHPEAATQHCASAPRGAATRKAQQRRRTAPVCFCRLATSTSSAASAGSSLPTAPTILAGFHRFTVPSTSPPAIKPSCVCERRSDALSARVPPARWQLAAHAAAHAPAARPSPRQTDSTPAGESAPSSPRSRPRAPCRASWTPRPAGKSAASPRHARVVSPPHACPGSPSEKQTRRGAPRASRHAVVLKLRSTAPAMVPTASSGAVGLRIARGRASDGELLRNSTRERCSATHAALHVPERHGGASLHLLDGGRHADGTGSPHGSAPRRTARGGAAEGT
jgi:hypothetical protein